MYDYKNRPVGMKNFTMTKQVRSEETRTHILQAAMTAFSQEGYDATGVAEICSRAGVSKGAFYHHFPSKQAVFVALLNQWLDGLDEMWANLPAPQNGGVPELLIQMAGSVGDILKSTSGQVPMFLEFWTQARRDDSIWQATMAPYQRYQDRFALLIQQGIDEGSFMNCNAEISARVMLSFAVGLFLQGVLDPQGTDWKQVAHDGVKTFIEGLKRSAA